MRGTVDFVSVGTQHQFLWWLAEALKDSPRNAIESLSFADVVEPNVGAYVQGP